MPAATRWLGLAMVSCIALGCTRSSSSEASSEQSEQSEQSGQSKAAAADDAGEAAAAVVDPRDQYALLDAIVEAKGEQLGIDPGILPRVRSEWINRRFRWEVALQPALCGAVGDCVVMPFDHASRSEPITQGWLPRLDLSTQERTALRERCADLRRCVVDVEGTLAQFELSTELPTSLTLREVTVHGARAATDGESWTVSKRRKRLATQAAAAVAALRNR